jgi:hypothetical protein
VEKLALPELPKFPAPICPPFPYFYSEKDGFEFKFGDALFILPRPLLLEYWLFLPRPTDD